MVGEIAVPVGVERAIDAGQQRRGRAHESALLHLEHLDRHQRGGRRDAVQAARATVPGDDPGHRRRVRGRGGVGRAGLRLAGDGVPGGREIVQVRMRAVDRPVQQRDRHALAVAAGGCERARGAAERCQVPGHRGRRIETPHRVHAGDLGRGAQLRDLVGPDRRRDRVERVDEVVLDGHPDAGAVDRIQIELLRREGDLRRVGALDGHRGRRRQHDDHLLRQGLARAAVPDQDVPRAQRLTQRVRGSVDGERDDASERCRQGENERARAQAAAARHDPLRVHEGSGALRRSTPPGDCARRRRARGSPVTAAPAPRRPPRRSWRRCRRTGREAAG